MVRAGVVNVIDRIFKFVRIYAHRRIVHASVLTALSAALNGCASPEAISPIGCADLSGRYENQSSPAGHKLAPFFFGVDDRAEAIDIEAEASSIVVTTPTRKVVLAQARDFVCGAQGISLTRTDVRNIRLPPLLVEKEVFHYVFGKAPDGSLRMTEQVESKGTSFGIPMGTGQKQQRSEVRWRAAPAP